VNLHSPKSRRWFLAALILVSGVVYLSTLLPGIGVSGDTAKFQFIGRYLGTPHPTGYPTYILLNHIFTRLFPFGSLAYRVNLLSALFAVGGLVYLYLLFIELEVHPAFSFLSGLAFAFTPTFWGISTIAEVYSLHMLFACATIFHFLRWSKTRSGRHFLAACTWYAFSFGNHGTMVCLLPAVTFIVFSTDWRILLDPRRIVQVSMLIMASVLQYAYFFWRTWDPKTVHLEFSAPDLSTFLYQVSGGHFRSEMFIFTRQQLITQRIPMFMQLAWEEFGLTLVLAVIGWMFFRQWRASLFLMLIFAGNGFFTLNYNVPDIQPFYLLNFLVIAIYLGLGMKELAKRLEHRQLLALAFAAFIPVLFLWRNLPEADHHTDTAKINETLAMLKTAGQDSLIITTDYGVYEYLMYYVIAEGWRERGIYVLNAFNLDSVQVYLEGGVPLYLPVERRSAPPGLDVYITYGRPSALEELRAAGYTVIEAKAELLFRVAR